MNPQKGEKKGHGKMKRALRALILKEIRGSKRLRNHSGGPDLQDLRRVKVAFLKEVLLLVLKAEPLTVWKQLLEFVHDCQVTYRLCRNPGLRPIFRLQLRAVQNIISSHRAAR